MSIHRSLGMIAAVAAVAACVCFAGGCGRSVHDVKRYEVRGVVIFKDEPVKNASVSFVSERFTAVGMTDEEGKFTLRSGAQAGAPAAQYKVGIVATDEESVVSADMSEEERQKALFDRMFGDYRPPQLTVPRRYGDPEKSGLTATVTESPDNYFEFTLAP